MKDIARRNFLLASLAAPALWEGAQAMGKGEPMKSPPKRFDTVAGRGFKSSGGESGSCFYVCQLVGGAAAG